MSNEKNNDPFPASSPSDPDAALAEELLSDYTLPLVQKLARLLLESRADIRELRAEVDRLKGAAGLM